MACRVGMSTEPEEKRIAHWREGEGPHEEPYPCLRAHERSGV